MNLLLHGIASEDADEIPVQVRDALAGKHGEYEMVLTNPPFGKKSSVTIVNEAGEEDRQSLVVHRDDFWASTSNKQLNFLQHVFTILKQHGRAAIDRHERTPTWSDQNPQGRWRVYDYDDLLKRDKLNLDIFWLKDESLEDSANLPDPDIIAQEIVEDLQAALSQFAEVASDLKR